MNEVPFNFGRSDSVVVNANQFAVILEALIDDGYTIVGPTIKDRCIIYDEIRVVDDLPVGVTDEQSGGAYRLRKRDDKALFGYTVGPHSWKKYLFPPFSTLWRAKRDGPGFKILEKDNPAKKKAFIGVRACELNAIEIQDKVFAEGEYRDEEYLNRRKDIFIIAANCTQAGGTCFCDSMKTGPRAISGFDLAMTEILEGELHYFLFEVGSEKGAAILTKASGSPAGDKEKAAAEKAIERAKMQMGRSVDTSGIKELLYNNSEHPRWDDVASRCLTCGNCTMVCPTCFCSSVEDYTDLKGEEAERRRRGDSCFTLEHSYIHGGSVRSTAKARYRQWLTHKFASWIDQFGTSGCVGCGRCITWCPVGIDITEEIRAIRSGMMASTAV
jgi:ferredoxin